MKENLKLFVPLHIHMQFSQSSIFAGVSSHNTLCPRKLSQLSAAAARERSGTTAWKNMGEAVFPRPSVGEFAPRSCRLEITQRFEPTCFRNDPAFHRQSSILLSFRPYRHLSSRARTRYQDKPCWIQAGVASSTFLPMSGPQYYRLYPYLPHRHRIGSQLFHSYSLPCLKL